MADTGFEFTADDFNVKETVFGRFDRKILDGEQNATVVSVKQVNTKGTNGKPIRPALELIVQTDPGPLSPEGPVKLSSTMVNGGYALKNFLEIFYPDSKGKSGKIADFDSLSGERLVILGKWKEAEGQWKAKGEIRKIVKLLERDDAPFGT
jgi:hypothetical protein